MKNSPILYTLIAILCMSGCKAYEVQSLQYLTSTETAQLIERNEVVTNIELKEIREYLLNSTWTSNRLITKGAHHLRISDGSDIYISYYGNFFWVEDRPGYFLITQNDRENFSLYFRRLMEEKVFPWRRLRNSEPEHGAYPDNAR